jgi:hypothetical protein
VTKTIYTAIFGPYDDLKEPFCRNQHWNYVCFTDQDIQSPTWEIQKVPVINNDPVKTARWYKINFHKHIDTEFSMWLDATFIINIDLNRWWKRFKAPFTTVHHPFDDCLYTDIISCMKGRKDDPGKLARQYAAYEDEGVPKNNGLISSGILMRQKEEKTIQLCETWWEQVEKYSCRDQVAFGYAQWKHPGVHDSIKWDYTSQREFIHIPHMHKPWRNEKLKEVTKLYGPNQSV